MPHVDRSGGFQLPISTFFLRCPIIFAVFHLLFALVVLLTSHDVDESRYRGFEFVLSPGDTDGAMYEERGQFFISSKESTTRVSRLELERCVNLTLLIRESARLRFIWEVFSTFSKDPIGEVECFEVF